MVSVNFFRSPQKKKAPAEAGAGIETPKLEGDLGRELNATWSATTQERVADTYVASCG